MCNVNGASFSHWTVVLAKPLYPESALSKEIYKGDITLEKGLRLQYKDVRLHDSLGLSDCSRAVKPLSTATH